MRCKDKVVVVRASYIMHGQGRRAGLGLQPSIFARSRPWVFLHVHSFSATGCTARLHRGSLSLHGGDRHLADWHRVFVGASTSATRRHDANVGQPASDRDAGCYHSRAQQEWPRHRCVQTPTYLSRGAGGPRSKATDTAVADRCDAERERPGDRRLAIRVKVESSRCRRPQQEVRQEYKLA